MGGAARGFGAQVWRALTGTAAGGAAGAALGPAWPGGGRATGLPRVRQWRTTSVQACGLYPFTVGGGAPLEGVPLGELATGAGGTLCADHISWFEQGLVSAPSAMVLGLNGLGKSTLVRRLVLGLAAYGVHTMVLGDIKPDYVDVVRALGGQVVRIGHGLGGINPLDAGGVGQAVAALAGHPREQAALVAAAHERKKTMVGSLVHIVRRRPPTDREEVILDRAVRVLEDRGGQPVLADLLQVVRDAPDELRSAALDRGDRDRYLEVTEPLEASLMALLSGRLGGIFAAAATEAMRTDRSVVFDVSATLEESEDVQAATLLAAWSYGFATIEIAQTLADAGVTARQRFNVVMDEMWRILRASSGLVDRVDALTRLNRTLGVGQVMVTHSMTDLDALPDQADRVKARGFVERSKMLFLGGLPPREMDLVSGVMALSGRERAMLRSWNAPGMIDPVSRTKVPPVGRGRFLLKTSDGPGTPFTVSLAAAEEALSDTNKRWDRSTTRGGGGAA